MHIGDDKDRDRDVGGSTPTVTIADSRLAQVGDLSVRRALPQRTRRTVGAWCFADHFGPATFSGDDRPDVGPHPHMGLQTVTWLVSGELVHRDSLGSEQKIKPGQLNLMSAGKGITHAEEASSPFRGTFHGIQLWIAQPEETRNGDPSFEHHRELPRVYLSNGAATVLVGSFAGITSPARRDSDHLGIELDLRTGKAIMPLQRDYEYALIVLSGALAFEGHIIEPGHLAYLGDGRDECTIGVRSPTRAILLGGVPIAEPILMWWNFVGRTRDEMIDAYRHWEDDDGWFGHVKSRLDRIPVAPPPWMVNR